MLGLYRNVVQLSNFDLNGVVEDTVTLFSRPLAKTGVSLERHLGNLSPIKGSADQFRQLLSNLVVNARDSMPNGGKLVIRTRETRSVDRSRGTVSITVADTGSGIPAELQKTVFEPFVSTKGEKGTGLGLWIVKGIVENHSGRIRVRSTVGRGTVMRLAFPISR
jgi:signal transduction histidine kinase